MNRYLRRRLQALAAVLIAAGGTGCGEDNPPRRERGPHIHVYTYGSTVGFGLGGDSHRFKMAGWSHTEELFTWTDGIGASLIMRVEASQGPVTLRIRAAGMTKPPALSAQPTTVTINGEKVANWLVGRDTWHSVVIPARFVQSPATLIIDLYTPCAVAPATLGYNIDPRRLGLACSELQILEGAHPSEDADKIAQTNAVTAEACGECAAAAQTK